jgi:hypothetical protein
MKTMNTIATMERENQVAISQNEWAEVQKTSVKIDCFAKQCKQCKQCKTSTTASNGKIIQSCNLLNIKIWSCKLQKQKHCLIDQQWNLFFIFFFIRIPLFCLLIVQERSERNPKRFSLLKIKLRDFTTSKRYNYKLRPLWIVKESLKNNHRNDVLNTASFLRSIKEFVLRITTTE